MVNLNEIQRMIDTAVLKGQIELLDMLRNQIDKDIALEYNQHTDAMKYVIQKVRYTLRNQLDYAATTEHTPLTADEMHPMIDDTPEDWDEGK